MTSENAELGTLLSVLRNRRGLSLAALARATYVSRGWINNVEAGRRWPSREWVEHAGRELHADGGLLAAWERGEKARASDEELRDLVQQSERESRLLLAIEPDAADLDTLNESVAELSVAYLASPVRPMLEQGVSIRQELLRRLKKGAVRLDEISDLYVALGRVSGVLAYATLDLGNPNAAMLHSEIAWKMGDIAGDNELRAWARGTQSLVSRFDQNYDRARSFIRDGMRHAGTGTSEIRLLCGAAQCAANLGDIAGAVRNIDLARRARECAGRDSIEGLFGFSPAKQAYYSASSLMWLPDKSALGTAVESAITAIDIWEHEPREQRSLDDESLAHVYLAIARMKLGEIDGAMESVKPVMELPEERRISWIRKRIGDLANVLDDEHFHNSPRADEVRAELRTYSA